MDLVYHRLRMHMQTLKHQVKKNNNKFTEFSHLVEALSKCILVQVSPGCYLGLLKTLKTLKIIYSLIKREELIITQ